MSGMKGEWQGRAKNDVPEPQQIPLPGFIRQSRNQRRWSLWITVGILLLQALVFAGTSFFLIATIDWEQINALEEPSIDVVFQVTQAGALVPFAVLALLCAFLCMVRPRLGWHVAMLAESLILLVALQVYFYDRDRIFSERPLLFVYMLGAILIVIFINSPEGRLLLVCKADSISPDQALEE